MTKQEEVQKALGIIDSLNEDMEAILNDVCQKNGITPLDYVVNQLRMIDARKKYCSDEGIQYEEYSQILLKDKLKSLFDRCQDAYSKVKIPFIKRDK